MIEQADLGSQAGVGEEDREEEDDGEVFEFFGEGFDEERFPWA